MLVNFKKLENLDFISNAVETEIEIKNFFMNFGL